MKEYKYKINGKDYNVVVNEIEDNIAKVEVNGKAYEVEMEKEVAPTIAPVAKPAAPAPTAAPAAQASTPSTGGKKSGVQSPLPGVIIDIKVSVGDVVKRGQTILILDGE